MKRFGPPLLIVIAAVAAGTTLWWFGYDHRMARADEDDKRCEVIGGAPNLSVPPADRLWFKENCICAGEQIGCGSTSSNRFSRRLLRDYKPGESK